MQDDEEMFTLKTLFKDTRSGTTGQKESHTMFMDLKNLTSQSYKFSLKLIYKMNVFSTKLPINLI